METGRKTDGPIVFIDRKRRRGLRGPKIRTLRKGARMRILIEGYPLQLPTFEKHKLSDIGSRRTVWGPVFPSESISVYQRGQILKEYCFGSFLHRGIVK